jgi:UDP-N-acetylmuramyl pentapeptide phosphotransferase/UDP-N-acetylglucosamine-1-phosphate transferase
MQIAQIAPQLPLLSGALTTFLVCLLIILTKSTHGHLTLDSANGVQKAHRSPTPRVGGLGLMAGAIVGWYFSPDVVKQVLGPALLASLPAFFFGTLEDLTKTVSVRARLLATLLSGVIACLLTGISIKYVHVPGVDYLLTLTPFSIIFTALAIAGLANAMNIIDGFNGLASGVMFICLAALGSISFLAGDVIMAKVCFVLGGVLFGFFILNFPFGKIFLGDGGAYLFGFLIGWCAILVSARNPSVSPWASLLACAYPIVEVLFSIIRRFRRNAHPGQPDRLHLHSLVRSRLIRKYLSYWPHTMQNAMVSPFIWIIVSIAGIFSVVFYTNTAALFMGFCFYFLLYLLVYLKIINTKR